MTILERLSKFDFERPTFADCETEELYFNCSLIQFRQDGIVEVIRTGTDEEVEAVKEIMKQMHLVFYNASYDLGTLGMIPAQLDDLFYLVKIAYPQFQEFSLDKVTTALGFGHLYAGIDKKALQKKGFMRKQYLSKMMMDYAKADVEALELMWALPKIQEAREVLAYKLSIYSLNEAMVWQDNGLPVLKDTLDKYIADATRRDIEYSQQLEDLVGAPLNPRSSKQVKEYMGTVSSDKATLTRIAIEGSLSAAKEYTAKVRVKAREAQEFTETQQQVAELVLLARKAKNDISKLQGYVGNEKMYGRFNPMGTSTSRWSCKGTQKGSSRPELFNAQNYSRDFKAVFGVKEGSGQIIVAADYATLEIRIAACMMAEPNMYQALMDGVDIHKATASMLFNKPVDEVHGKERSNAKVANFGLTYGMGKETFKHYAYDMYGLKLTDAEADDTISKFFKAYPALKTYHNGAGKKMKRGGYIYSTALDFRAKPKMYAEAINGPTQGTGGECMRLAIHIMVKKDKDSLKYIVNSIHDALYLIVPEIDKDYWGKLLQESMQEAWYEIRKSRHFKWHDVPMPVDLMLGYNMGELEEDFAGGGQSLTIAEIKEQKERNALRETV